MVDVLKFALEYGFLGLAVLVLSSAIRVMYRDARNDRKEKDDQVEKLQAQLSAEQTLRVEDAKRFTEVALKLQGEVISSVQSIEKASGENAKLCGFVEKLVDTVEDLLERLPKQPQRRF